MADPESIGALSEALVGELLAAGKTVSIAESCTGGWIAKSLTDNSGSSGCFGYGLVSYSNGAKESLLGVNPATLEEHGAVSEAAVREMANGALNLSGADIAAAVIPNDPQTIKTDLSLRVTFADIKLVVGNA